MEHITHMGYKIRSYFDFYKTKKSSTKLTISYIKILILDFDTNKKLSSCYFHKDS